MSKKLLLIYGKSGSGKTYLCKVLNLKLVISHTTRPRRGHEIDGEHYYFITEDIYRKIPQENKIAEVLYNGYKYFTVIGELVKKNVYIAEPSGIINTQKYIKEHGYDFDITVIQIQCNIFKRIYRMIQRGDGVINSIKRALLDIKHFKEIDHHFTIRT